MRATIKIPDLRMEHDIVVMKTLCYLAKILARIISFIHPLYVATQLDRYA